MLPEEGGGIEIYAKNKTGSIYCIFFLFTDLVISS